MTAPLRLRPANVTDQRIPCSAVRNDEACRSRAAFRIWPSCSCAKDVWPDVQSCSGHLAGVVRLASKLCEGHWGGKTVLVRPL